jgi:hypothetical protein
MLDVFTVDEKYFNSKIETLSYAWGLNKKRFYYYAGNPENIAIIKIKDTKIEIIFHKRDESLMNMTKLPSFEKKLKEELKALPDGEYAVDVSNVELVYNLTEKTEVNWFSVYPSKVSSVYKGLLAIGIDVNREEKLYIIENNSNIGLINISIIQSRSSSLIKPKEITEFGSELFYKLTKKRMSLDGNLNLSNPKDFMIPLKEESYLAEKHLVNFRDFIGELKRKESIKEIRLSDIVRQGFIPVVKETTDVIMDHALPPAYKFSKVELTKNGRLNFITIDTLVGSFYESATSKLKQFLGIEELFISYQGRETPDYDYGME